MPINVENNIRSVVNAAISTNDTSIVIKDGTSFPKVDNASGDGHIFATLANKRGDVEIVEVDFHPSGSPRIRVANRGVGNTTAFAWDIGDFLEIRPTAELFKECVKLSNDLTPKLSNGLDANNEDIINLSDLNTKRVKVDNKATINELNVDNKATINELNVDNKAIINELEVDSFPVVTEGSTPVGSLITSISSERPISYLLCDGTSVPSGNRFLDLIPVLGSGVNLPDFTGRTINGVTVYTFIKY